MSHPKAPSRPLAVARCPNSAWLKRNVSSHALLTALYACWEPIKHCITHHQHPGIQTASGSNGRQQGNGTGSVRQDNSMMRLPGLTLSMRAPSALVQDICPGPSIVLFGHLTLFDSTQWQGSACHAESKIPLSEKSYRQLNISA